MNRRQFFVAPLAITALGIGAASVSQKKVIRHEVHLDDYIEVAPIPSHSRDSIEIEIRVNTEKFALDINKLRESIIPSLQEAIGRHDVVLFGPGSRQAQLLKGV